MHSYQVDAADLHGHMQLQISTHHSVSALVTELLLVAEPAQFHCFRPVVMQGYKTRHGETGQGLSPRVQGTSAYCCWNWKRRYYVRS